MTGYDGRGARFPLTIVRGADMAFQLTVVDSGGSAVNLSAATIAGEVYTTAGALVDTLGAVVSGAGSNIVTLAFTDTETALFTATRYNWTLWVTRGGDKRPWLAGDVYIGDGTNGQVGATSDVTLTVDTDLTVDVTVNAIGTAGTGGAIRVEDEGVSVVAAATALNFAGTGVTVTDAGSDEALVTISSGGSGANLAWVAASSQVTSDSGTDATLTAVDGSNPGLMTVAMLTKLNGIEAAADVTDTANVTSAGALMDSEVDADLKTLSLPANTTISTFGASLIDDTSAQAAVATLRTAPATVTGTTDTLAAADDDTVILYTAAGAVTVTLANIATGFEAVLVSLGAGGLAVAAGGMSFANSFTPKLTVAQGEALYVKQTAASTFIVLGGTAT